MNWKVGGCMLDVRKISLISSYDKREQAFSIVIDGQLMTVAGNENLHTDFIREFAREFPIVKTIA
jgi:hypothetical protein